MHCTAGDGRTGIMLMSYLWYKKFLLDRNINKPLVAIFDAAISSDKSPDYTEISKRIKDTELFKNSSMKDMMSILQSCLSIGYL